MERHQIGIPAHVRSRAPASPGSLLQGREGARRLAGKREAARRVVGIVAGAVGIRALGGAGGGDRGQQPLPAGGEILCASSRSSAG
jgi:hypothetical protein